MSRLDAVIKQVKDARKVGNVPWIYDKNGKVKDDVLMCDVLYLLKALKEYEIEISNFEIEKYLETDYICAENTYNWDANISNDLDWKVYKKENNSNIAIIKVHLFGDIRSCYSDYFVVSIGDCESFLEFVSYSELVDETLGYIKLNDKYEANYDMFSSVIMVYNTDGDEIGEFYEIEKDELLKDVIETERLLKKIQIKGGKTNEN